jgi:hypothetical protein
MSIDDYAGGLGRGVASLLWRNLDDPVAQVTRPVTQFAGFARVPLSPGEQVRVTFRLHADRTSFTAWTSAASSSRAMVGASSHDIRLRGSFQLAASCAPSARSGCW